MGDYWNVPPAPGSDKLHNWLSYRGRSSYICYHSYQKLFTTWLASSAAVFRVHVESVAPMRTEIVVAFIDLVRLAEVISRHGTVPPSALEQIDFMIKLRGGWDPRNFKKPPGEANEEDDEEHAHRHFLAMSTLRMVRKFLSLAPVAPEVPEVADTDPPKPQDIYTLPELPGEAFCEYSPIRIFQFPVLVMSVVGHALQAFCALKTVATQGALSRPITNPGALVAWVCYFNDVFVIRTYLKAYWHGYLHSFETLTTRALVTNAAIMSVSYDLLCFSSNMLQEQPLAA